MKISIDPAVFALAPQFKRYVLLVEGFQNALENKELLALLRAEEQKIREDVAFADIKNHPRLMVWRDLFSAFGINPNRCPPSVANLIKRVRSGTDLPFVNSLVCIFNIISLRYAVPAGGDDLDQVRGDIVLRPATGSENYIPLGRFGEENVYEHPKPGEVILMDTATSTVLCRAWCWKNGDVTKIMPNTRRAAVNLDILPPLTLSEGQELAETAKQLMERHGQAFVQLICLDTANKEFCFKTAS